MYNSEVMHIRCLQNVNKVSYLDSCFIPKICCYIIQLSSILKTYEIQNLSAPKHGGKDILSMYMEK